MLCQGRTDAHVFSLEHRFLSAQDIILPCLTMPLVTRYSNLRKLDSSGNLTPLTPLRAAGLACELGHKLCKAKGRGNLEVDDLRRISLSGTLQKKELLRWRRVPTCELELATDDAQLAYSVVLQQREFFADINFNLWQVDRYVGSRLGSCDLIGEFSTGRNFGVQGLTWVELKILSAYNFNEKYERHRLGVAAKLPRITHANDALEAAMLVAAKVEKNGRSWVCKSLVAQLLVPDDQGDANWKTLAGKAPSSISAGRTNPLLKPTLQQIWDQIEVWTDPTTAEDVYLASNFLALLGLPDDSLKKRCRGFNDFLRRRGVPLLYKRALPNRPGAPPWVGTKETFRSLYKAL